MGWGFSGNPYRLLYNISGIPTAYLLDKNGYVVSKEAYGDMLSVMIKKYLAQQPSSEIKK